MAGSKSAEQVEAGNSEGRRSLSLGQFLAGGRQERSLSQAELAEQAHIPLHYVRMLEADNYANIADQLYLLPFLRRYAAFLGLDADDLAMRFVRDVQRAEGGGAVKIPGEAKSVAVVLGSGWITTAAVMVFVVAAVYLATFERRHWQEPGKPQAQTSAAPSVVALAPTVRVTATPQPPTPTPTRSAGHPTPAPTARPKHRTGPMRPPKVQPPEDEQAPE